MVLFFFQAADKKTTVTYTITIYKDRLSMRPETVASESLESCPLSFVWG